MKMQDAFDQLASDCELLAVVLANPSLEDFELCDPTTPLPAEIAENLHARQLACFGCVGLGAGNQFRSAFVSALPESTIRALAHAFGLFAAKKLSPEHRSVDWLERLHSLPDTRTDN